MARLMAMDLGAWATKVTTIQNTGRTQELEGTARQRIPQDGTQVPSMADRLASVTSLVRKNPEWSSEAHLVEASWRAGRASRHLLQLPFTEKSQIEQTLPFVVESEVPFDLDEMVLGWREGDEEGQVVVTLAPKASLRRMVDGLDEAGLNPRRVVVETELLACYGREGEVTAVLDVGHQATKVALVRDGEVISWRALGVAGRAFTLAIQRAAM